MDKKYFIIVVFMIFTTGCGRHTIKEIENPDSGEKSYPLTSNEVSFDKTTGRVSGEERL